MAILMQPMRRSSLIGPWGVGAIVPFPNDESLMIAGLDAWKYEKILPFVIKDERLTRRLGVSELRWPPDFRDSNADPTNCNLKIPAVRFPNWYYCPFCGQMKKTTYYETHPKCDAIQWEKGRKCSDKGKYRKPMIPERFIVVCPQGHIDDFPVAEWVHSDGVHVYNRDTCKIRRSTGGTSANLTGVNYECTCGAKKSMAGATKPGALQRTIGYRCTGAKPWLGITGGELCNAGENGNDDIKVVLRGATNVWFADTQSSISIPVSNSISTRTINGLVNKYLNGVNSNRQNGELNREVIKVIAEANGVDTDDLYRAFYDRVNNRLSGGSDGNVSEEEYRYQEYQVLSKDSGSDTMDFHSIKCAISDYDPVIRDFFESISLVPKLRETRAFIGFSRLEPRNDLEHKNDLRLGRSEDWLPAIEVYGEGLFFKFDSQYISEWASRANVINRLDGLNRAYHRSKYSGTDDGNLRPEYVLIHTFAHLIINRLSYDCGYGSSSIRERIYCEKTGDDFDMCGVLIYTASGDSEGSLGGLVRQGDAGRLEDIVVNAIRNAAWCTSDPICIQSAGQGPESLNLAACHNCALLPETCCENGNRLLDRGLIVGTLDDPDMGYFRNLL